MTITEALETLDKFQAQIIHGPTTFRQIGDVLRELERRKDTVETALRELVELKDLRAKIDGPKEAFRDNEDYEAAVESYYNRKAVAWGAARAALSSENAGVHGPRP